MTGRLNGKMWYVISGGALTVVNILVAAMVGYLLQDIRALRNEMSGAVSELRQANFEQDKMSAAIRQDGFQRLSSLEAKAIDNSRRLDRIETITKTP